ncbi:MAG: hypothetical protein JRE43_00785 [Deltaproteobacteria bacterium]|nr:hypothetical protein [Deltaproteobacteria bacterium]MBW2541175.1 hypothetical protein [Deltaproteobacteria bacterium]
MKRKLAISRRQFLTGAFRGRDAAPPEAEAPPALPRDLARAKLAERYCFAWNEEPETPDWEKGLDGVLEEMENLKGIEDF